MERNKKEKRKLKIIYDIIPPYLARDIIFVEKKVSKIVKASYLFLKTSKYGSIVLVLGVALFGGTILLGFSPKTEIAEIYPTAYEGDWISSDKASVRDLTDSADLSDFSFENSTTVIFPENSPEETTPDIPLSGEENLDNTEKEDSARNIEEEINGSSQRLEPTEGDNIPMEPEAQDLPAEQTGSAQSMEPAEETPPDINLEEPTEDQNQQTEETEQLLEEPSQPAFYEEIGFWERTRELFFANKARARDETESLDDPNSTPSNLPPLEEESLNSDALLPIEEGGEEIDILQEGSARSMEPTNTLPLPEGEMDGAGEEKFEDYSGIIVPNVDGEFPNNAELEQAGSTQSMKPTESAEETTIFTNKKTAVFSGFKLAEETGELKKARIGFSFASEFLPDTNDEVIIDWSLDGESWNEATVIKQNKTVSNKENGGYFYAVIFDSEDPKFNKLLSRENIESLKVRFTALTSSGDGEFIPAYLDAVWLETEQTKTKENGKDRIEILSDKKGFKIGEKPEFKLKYKKGNKGFLVSIGEALGVVDYWNGINMTAEITTPRKETIEIPRDKFNEFFEDFALEKNGEISMKLKKNKDFKPGLYNVVLKIEENGETQEFNWDFTWGVLAINTNKSIYLSGEEAYLQMAALKDDGHTICNARLEFRILNLEFGTETILSTEDGTIKYSGKCSGNNVTNVPDYFAYYTTGETGTYEMKLTNLDNGYEINDSFEVRESVPFEVERIGPTRIYPPADYEMVLKIKANQDFNGEIRERVPESFEIKNTSSVIARSISDAAIPSEKETDSQEGSTQSMELTGDQNSNIRIENCDIKNSLNPPADGENCKFIIWQTNLKSGESYEIKYIFDAPDISPDLHLLGPLGFYE